MSDPLRTSAEMPSISRLSTVIHQPDEIWNVQSAERTGLLLELKSALQHDTLSAPLWACLQVCDVEKLQELVVSARHNPGLFCTLESSSLSIPLHWMQRSPDDRTSTPSTPSSTNSNQSGPRKRPRKAKTKAMQRDKDRCVITKASLIEVAHIFPVSLIHPQPTTNRDACIPSFWHMLRLFFNSDRLQEWQMAIFSDPNDPTKAKDGCYNQMCLSVSAHRFWTRGYFALRPVARAPDGTSMAIEFHWQPRPSHGRFDSVDILQQPGLSRGLTDVDQNTLDTFAHDGNRNIVRSGDIFVFSTDNPDTHPLPSWDLLQMQWYLQRIVSMSGAADAYDDYDYDDDDYDVDAPDTFQIRESVQRMFSDMPRSDPSVSSNSSDDDDNQERSVTTASAGPSPMKTRQLAINTTLTQTNDSEVPLDT